MPAELDCSAQAALIIQTGRLRGNRFALRRPATLIGQSEGCDLRLIGERILPIHCIISHGSDGWIVRATSDQPILLDGQPTVAARLTDAQRLVVGGYEFDLCIPPTQAESAWTDPGVAEALRIQAAAVTAQQTQLTEEELRLDARRAALEEQEKQLASRLDQRQRQLDYLHEQLDAARAALRQERRTSAEELAKRQDLLQHREQELAQLLASALAQRKRLRRLHQRLLRRFKRQWADAQRQIAQREQQLHRALRKHAAERQSFEQALRRFNTQVILEHHRRQQASEDFVARLADREAALAQLDQQVARLHADQLELAHARDQLTREQADLRQERETWAANLAQRQEQSRTLEQRIANLHQTLLQLEQTREQSTVAMHASSPTSPGTTSPSTTSPGTTSPGTTSPGTTRADTASADPASAGCGELSDWSEPIIALPDSADAARAHYHRQLIELNRQLHDQRQALEQSARQLAAERLSLTEQAQQLAQSHRDWQNQQAELAGQLEELSRQLAQRESELLAAEATIGQQREQLASERAIQQSQRLRLELWHNQLVAQRTELAHGLELAHDQAQAHLQHAQRQRQALTELTRRWVGRRQTELSRLRAEFASLAQLQQSYRERLDQLQQQHRLIQRNEQRLLQQTLALETLRQELFAQANDSHFAQRRLARIERRGAASQRRAEKALSQLRQHLQADLHRLSQQFADWQQLAQQTMQQMHSLTQQQANLEQQQLQLNQDRAELAQHQTRWQCERAALLQANQQLREQFERFAYHLIESPPCGLLEIAEPTVTQMRAA